ncbi:hypothetical protein D3C86_2159880 [compost metagenome]
MAVKRREPQRDTASTLFSAVKAVQDTLSVLKRDGTPKARQPDVVSYLEYCERVGLADFQSLDDRFG